MNESCNLGCGLQRCIGSRNVTAGAAGRQRNHVPEICSAAEERAYVSLCALIVRGEEEFSGGCKAFCASKCHPDDYIRRHCRAVMLGTQLVNVF